MDEIKEMLDEFVSLGLVRCIRNEETGHLEYSIDYSTRSFIRSMLISEATASCALDRDEIGTYSIG